MISKQAVTIGAAVLISVGILSFAVQQRIDDGTINFSESDREQTSAIASQFYELDTDGDGLKNWEEFLWETDPTLVDTDGDGTNDNEETLTGRDPTIPGPNDRRFQNVAVVDTTSNQSAELSTEGLAGAIVAEYLIQKESGDFDGRSGEQIVAELLDENVEAIQITTFSQTDLSEVPETEDSLLAYQAAISNIFLTFQRADQYEMELILESMRNNNPELLNKVDASTSIYDDGISNLLATPVPASIAAEHLEFINTLHVLNELIKNTRGVIENPVLALASLQTYTELEPRFFVAANQLARALENRL